MAENKEILKQTPETVATKPETMTDVQERPGKVPKEIETWMQRIEKDPTRMKTVTDINGQPLLTTSSPQKPVIVLPITRGKFLAGFKKTIDEAGRWLSTFVLRLIKRKQGEVKFKDK
jgi:hypothetical protein